VRLVFVTQSVDATHPNLAATIDMIRALAQRCDDVLVVGQRVGPYELPANVSVHAFDAPRRGRRLARFVAAVNGAVASRPDALLAHMVPHYVLLAAPLCAPRRVPILLWYTHWKAHLGLRAAARLSAAVLSVDRRSFPLETDKVRGIGHAIDVDRFSPRREERAADGLRFLALGRTQPWKGLPELLEAFRRASGAGLDAELEIRGPQLTDEERGHRRELEGIVAAEPVLRERVTIADAVERDRIPELLAGADAVVGAARRRADADALDKVVYEASACAVPVIASNPALEEHLSGLPVRLLFAQGDVDDLARTLVEFAASPAADRRAAGLELRRRAVERHSVDSWADAVVAAVREVSAR
jgi:glycosyltransferase involved in cell wall biosynthesis